MSESNRDVVEAYRAEIKASGYKTEACKLMAEASPKQGVAQSRGGVETEALESKTEVRLRRASSWPRQVRGKGSRGGAETETSRPRLHPCYSLAFFIIIITIYPSLYSPSINVKNSKDKNHMKICLPLTLWLKRWHLAEHDCRYSQLFQPDLLHSLELLYSPNLAPGFPNTKWLHLA
jgi:hypothetical protein